VSRGNENTSAVVNKTILKFVESDKRKKLVSRHHIIRQHSVGVFSNGLTVRDDKQFKSKIYSVMSVAELSSGVIDLYIFIFYTSSIHTHTYIYTISSHT